jgi:polyhydroxybutyrate depolymerase
MIVAAFQVALVSSAAAETMWLTVDGVERTFLVERPAMLQPRPTLIMLHGAGGSAAQVAGSTGLAELAPRHGFVVVFPEGRGGRWNHLPPGEESTQFVRVFEPYGGAPDDVAFLKSLVADLIGRGISDPSRIFLAGESAGGLMTLRMFCAGTGMFAGIGLLIAAMPVSLGATCDQAKAVPALLINGTADQVLPYDGGRAAPPDRAFPAGTFSVWSTDRLVALFRKLNGCVPPPEVSVVAGPHPQTIELQQSTACVGGRVSFYRVVDGGHAVPPDLGVAELLLDFFRG